MGDTGNSNDMYFRVDQNPPWFAAILLGFQQVMVCISGIISMPSICLAAICAGSNVEARMLLISTTLVTTGFSTILQTTVGIRIPMLQGPSAAFIPPVVGLMAIDRFKCSENEDANAWMDRMVYIQGGQIVASIIQMLIGGTGFIGLLTNHIGPLTIAPLMILLELSLVEVILHYVLLHWVSVLMIFFLILFSLYLPNISVPFFVLSNRRCISKRFPVFSLFPYVLAIAMTWLLCAILTYSGALELPFDLAARVDNYNQTRVITDSPWVRFPYPGQWGVPKVSLAVTIGMIAATICSVLESVGDYHACARVAQEPRPPTHAMNRGILIEGFGCFIGGFLGGGMSVTSYSEIIGAIGITKVASRLTMQIAGVIMILMGIFTKFGALLATIPEPLFGGTLFLSMSMVMGVGVSSLRLADMSLSRNMAVVGTAVLTGVLVPRVVEAKPVSTGYQMLDDVVTIFCSMPLIIGGLMGFFLDTTLPGATRKQRGLLAGDTSSVISDKREEKTKNDVYSFPPKITGCLDRVPFSRLIPFLPTYGQRSRGTVAVSASTVV